MAFRTIEITGPAELHVKNGILVVDQIRSSEEKKEKTNSSDTNRRRKKRKVR